MTEISTTAFTATGRTESPMFEVLEATSDDVVAVRMGHGSPDGYREFYDLLVD